MSSSSPVSPDDPGQPDASRASSFGENLEKAGNVAGRVATVIVGLVYIVLAIVAFAFSGSAPITVLIGLLLLAYGIYLVSPRPRWKFVIY